MKDKEIEGMQIRICNACKQYKKCDKELCTMSGLVAKELSRFYQPKLPKDSVVLSRDNYNRLKRDSDLFEELLKKKVHLETVIELSNAQYEKVVEENKSLLRLISLIDDLPEESLLDLDKSIEAIKAKERKETAEKILFKFESAFAYYDNEDMFSKKAIFECLEELAKQFGVEIKE